jgi:uncharacterized membrane protein YhaH (DUF805 family)
MTTGASLDPALGGSNVGFLEAIATCFRKYVGFRGRARRPEYWYWVLFQVLLTIAGLLVDRSLHLFNPFLSLALFLPGLAVTVRRLHDTDRSGWWVLISIIPLLGTIVLLIMNCRRGTEGPNRFGPEFAHPVDAFAAARPSGGAS